MDQVCHNMSGKWAGLFPRRTFSFCSLVHHMTTLATLVRNIPLLTIPISFAFFSSVVLRYKNFHSNSLALHFRKKKWHIVKGPNDFFIKAQKKKQVSLLSHFSQSSFSGVFKLWWARGRSCSRSALCSAVQKNGLRAHRV